MQSATQSSVSLVPVPAKKRILPHITQDQIRRLVFLRGIVEKHKFPIDRESLRQLEAELHVLIEAGAEIEPGEFMVRLESNIRITRSR